MALDPSIALQVQTPNPANAISSFLDLGQKKLSLDRARATYDSDVAGSKAVSSSAQSRATVDAANVRPLIAQQAASTDQAQTAAQQTHFNLTKDQAQTAMQQASGLMSNPAIASGNADQAIEAVLDAKDRAIQMGVPRAQAEVMFGRLMMTAHDNPAGLPQALKDINLGSQAPSGQAAAIAPSGIAVGNGQQTSVVNTNPFAPGGVGSTIPGTPQQQQLPPTAQTMVNGQPQYVGPKPAMPAGGGAPVPSGPAIGQVEGTVGPVAANNAHYAQVTQDATGASNRIAALQNIKQEIPKAIMGGNLPGNTIRSVLSGLSGIFGFANDATTANDLMAKNLAQIAAQSGNTDAARTMGEMGSPNAHVTADAAREAVAQIYGVEAKKQSASSYFSGTPTNSPDYSNKLTMWNKYADPRAFQYAALPPDEQKAMKDRMVKAGTWKTLNDNMSHLAAMGVNP